MDSNNVIGKNGKIPWLIKEDLQYFKYITLGSVVIMGRNTYDSIGRCLKYRKNVILTRKKNFHAKNCEIARSVSESIRNIFPYDKCYIIGGSQIYSSFHLFCNHLFITKISKNFKGDSYFPNIDTNKWKLLKSINRKSYILVIYRNKVLQ